MWILFVFLWAIFACYNVKMMTEVDDSYEFSELVPYWIGGPVIWPIVVWIWALNRPSNKPKQSEGV